MSVSGFERLAYLDGRRRLSVGMAARLWVALYRMTSRPSFSRSDNWVHPSSIRSDEAEVARRCTISNWEQSLVVHIWIPSTGCILEMWPYQGSEGKRFWFRRAAVKVSSNEVKGSGVMPLHKYRRCGWTTVSQMRLPVWCSSPMPMSCTSGLVRHALGTAGDMWRKAEAAVLEDNIDMFRTDFYGLPERSRTTTVTLYSTSSCPIV